MKASMVKVLWRLMMQHNLSSERAAQSAHGFSARKCCKIRCASCGVIGLHHVVFSVQHGVHHGVGHDFWEAFRCEEKHILARLVQLFVKHAGRRDQVSVSSLSRGSGFSTVFSTARGSTLMLPPACEPPCTACSTKDVAASSDECPKRQQRRRRW